jgi:drug/metabolite transporter (DMT)-like permease
LGVLILFALIVVLGTVGELCLARAMKAVGEVSDFRPLAIAKVFWRALHVGWMWAGVGMMAVAFFALLGALSFENVSFVVPVTALSYLAGTCGGAVFLGEHVTPQRWLGVSLVVVGVTLVVMGKG